MIPVKYYFIIRLLIYEILLINKEENFKYSNFKKDEGDNWDSF